MTTRQEIFDRVATHLLTQNEQAIRSGGISCAYRGEGGLKCAIGALILDEHYDPAFEGQSPTDQNVAEALIASGLDSGFVYDEDSFLCGLQALHDGFAPETWLERLDQFALYHDLFFTPPSH